MLLVLCTRMIATEVPPTTTAMTAMTAVTSGGVVVEVDRMEVGLMEVEVEVEVVRSGTGVGSS